MFAFCQIFYKMPIFLAAILQNKKVSIHWQMYLLYMIEIEEKQTVDCCHE